MYEQDRFTVELLKVNDNSLVIYSKVLNPIPDGWTYDRYLEYQKRQAQERANARKTAGEEFTGTRKPGIISRQAQNKIMKRVSKMAWLTGAKRLTRKRRFIYNPERMTFLTLTLPGPQLHTDNEIKKQCLNQFLTELRFEKSIKLYIWRAEKTKAGTLHFHILLDRFIPFMTLRTKWNRCINKLGYVDRYTAKMSKMTLKEYTETYGANTYENDKSIVPGNDKATFVRLKQRYERGAASGWKDPNSIDIHRVKKARSIEGYISKYLSKKEKNEITGEYDNTFLNEGDEAIQGNIWYSSKELQGKVEGIELTPDLRKLLWKIENLYNDRVYVPNDYCTVIRVSLQELFENYIYDFYDIYKEQVLKKAA